jgi:hypothetical protein
MSVTFHDILVVYYKEAQQLYNNIDSQQYTIRLGENPNENVAEIYNNDKKIMSSKYELLGIYDETTNLFVWGSSIIPANKNDTLRVRDIREYSSKIKSFILNKKFSDVGFLERLLYYLSENIVYIIRENISDLTMLCVFVSKKFVVFKSNANTNVTSIYLLTDVLSY